MIPQHHKRGGSVSRDTLLHTEVHLAHDCQRIWHTKQVVFGSNARQWEKHRRRIPPNKKSIAKYWRICNKVLVETYHVMDTPSACSLCMTKLHNNLTNFYTHCMATRTTPIMHKASTATMWHIHEGKELLRTKGKNKGLVCSQFSFWEQNEIYKGG